MCVGQRRISHRGHVMVHYCTLLYGNVSTFMNKMVQRIAFTLLQLIIISSRDSRECWVKKENRARGEAGDVSYYCRMAHVYTLWSL